MDDMTLEEVHNNTPNSLHTGAHLLQRLEYIRRLRMYCRICSKYKLVHTERIRADRDGTFESAGELAVNLRYGYSSGLWVQSVYNAMGEMNASTVELVKWGVLVPQHIDGSGPTTYKVDAAANLRRGKYFARLQQDFAGRC